MHDEYVVWMNDITVTFPGVVALDKVYFNVIAGEVHVLLGENGAGKSTIMKVLAGVNTVYNGEIFLKGQPIVSRSVHEQRERGVSIIFQEMNLLKNLTVAENIFLGRQPVDVWGNVDWNKMFQNARTLLDSIGTDISEKALVSALSVGQMQMIEIAKAISFKSEVIIMDEPTSALTEKEVENLFNLITKLKAEKVAVVYISHRLEEIIRIGDRVTVLRDGKCISTLKVEDTTVNELVKLMVGRELSEQYPKVTCPHGGTLLEVINLNQGNQLKNISFYARGGEITGFYGLMGSGRTETMRAIFGADKYDSGEIRIKGNPVRIRNCKDATGKGIALLTEDRKNQGLILSFGVKENIVLTNLNSIMRYFGLSATREKTVCAAFINVMRIKTPSLKQKVKNLSGGNQQKVVVAKWLNHDADIIIFDEPTRGIDVGAKVEIYKTMNKMKEEGKAIIMVSSELPETMGVSDRIYVMRDGKIVKCFDETKGLIEDDIMKYAAGV